MQPPLTGPVAPMALAVLLSLPAGARADVPASPTPAPTTSTPSGTLSTIKPMTEDKRVKAEDIDSVMQDGKVFFLDVREPKELEEFGTALTRIQQLVGDSFASAQGGRFHPRAGARVDALLRLGAAGAGQSSWGPTVYGVVGSEAAGRELAGRMDAVVDGGASVEVVTFDNRGARVEAS